MHNKKQMKIAKHSLAIWLNPNDPESLKEQLRTCSSSWYNLPQRTLKKWVKTLYANPEKYEFTALAYKEKNLEDHFSTEEIERNQFYFEKRTELEKKGIRENAVIYRWVNKLEPDEAFREAYKSYMGTSYKKMYAGYNTPKHDW